MQNGKNKMKGARLIGLFYFFMIIVTPLISVIVGADIQMDSDLRFEINDDSECKDEVNDMLNSQSLLENILGQKLMGDLRLQARKTSQEELKFMKKINGKYIDGKNYNLAINGHSTGLKPLSDQDWIDFSKKSNAVEAMSLNGTILMANTKPSTILSKTLSSSVDHTKSKHFPPIGNQGAEGSCVAWSAGYYTKTFQEASEHNWNLSGASWTGGSTGQPTTSYQDKIMSPDFIYHQINNGVDKGSTFVAAMDLCNLTGAATWKNMPYKANDHTSWPSEAAWREAPLYRAGNGFNYIWVYPPYNSNGLTMLKTWIDNGNLALIAVDAYKYSSLSSKDLWTKDNYNYPSVNHANTIVGYDNNFGPYSEDGYNRYGAFKVANSWGTGWTGDNDKDGCYWISYEAMKYRVYYSYLMGDRIGYKPKLVSVFKMDHQYRGECNITIGIGNSSNPNATKRFDDWYNDYDGGNHPFPANNMVLDITEFNEIVQELDEKNYFIEVYDYESSTVGKIMNFSIELYSDYKNKNKLVGSASTDPPVKTKNKGRVFAEVILSSSPRSVKNVDTKELFSTIQSAIDDKDTQNGHTIEVGHGVYYENVIISKSISLIGNDSLTTVIDGGLNADVIIITADDVNLTGFMITNSGNNGPWPNDDAGLELENVQNCTIYENNISANNYYGVRLKGSSNITFNRNVISNNENYGVSFQSSKNITFINNTFYKNNGPYNVLTNSPGGNVFKNNMISYNTGVGLYLYDNNTVFNNTFIQNNKNGIEIVGSNNVIEDNEMLQNEGSAIYVSCSNNSISSNSIRDNKNGIQLTKSDNNQISYNNLKKNMKGIYTKDSKFNDIMNNSIELNCHGIYLHDSDINSIYNNTITKNTVGVHLSTSDNNLVANNTCRANIHDGIKIISSQLNLIEFNNVQNNKIGTTFDIDSINNVFKNNIVSSSKEVGIVLNNNSNNNILYHNKLLSNSKQVTDNCSNKWYFDLEGNFWSDYTGLDDGSGTGKHAIAGDHIGDTNLPHQKLDRYPFTNQLGWLYPSFPIMSKPADFDSDGNYTISWFESKRTEEYVLEEAITQTFEFSSQIYKGTGLSYSVNDRTDGTYYYRLKASNSNFETNWSKIINITVDFIPHAPTDLRISVYPEGNAINLSWDLNTGDTKEYILMCKTDSTFEFVDNIIHPENSYNHSGLQNSVEYEYKLQARDNRGQLSGFSDIVKATPEDSKAPAQPKGLTVESTTDYTIVLSWLPNLDDDIKGYNIYRSCSLDTLENNILGKQLNAELIKHNRFTDRDLDETTEYYYVITALDEVPNESEGSDIVCGKTQLGQHAPEINNSLDVVNILEDTCDDSSINLQKWFKDVNSDELSFRCEDQEHIQVTINQLNGTVVLTPEKDWNGQETLSFFVSDGYFEISDKVDIHVLPINDPPGQVDINSTEEIIQITNEDPLNLMAICDDPDVIYGDVLTFNWYSSTSGHLGDSEVLNNVRLPVGEHIITVEVTDLAGLSSTATIKIEVIQVKYDDSIESSDEGITPDKGQDHEDKQEEHEVEHQEENEVEQQEKHEDDYQVEQDQDNNIVTDAHNEKPNNSDSKDIEAPVTNSNDPANAFTMNLVITLLIIIIIVVTILIILFIKILKKQN